MAEATTFKPHSIKPLQHAYLSLGSNLGNKFDFLQQAVQAIFTEIGNISKISSVYQSPAMGFEGDDFLNCVVLVETTLSPQKLLDALLAIEKKLGRVRTANIGYTSRPIDMDILFIDDLVKETARLHIPHPRLQDRKFVLQPLAEVAAQLLHPVLQKKVIKLLAETPDTTPLVKQSKWLSNPIKNYQLSRYNYIAIEGNIGAGKTSLSNKIAHDFNAKLILERFKDNPFLPKFYEEPGRFAFPLEMSFLADRYQQLLEDMKQLDLFQECIIADYDAYKSMIFAKVTLQQEEFTLYKKLFHLMHKELPQPDLYVYLYQDTERLLENIQKRGRSFEKSIEASYLQKINEGYLEFIKSRQSDHIKLLDISAMDFVNDRRDYLSILEQLFGVSE